MARFSGYQLEVQVKTRIWQLNLLRRCPVRAAVATVTTVEAKCRACCPVCRSAGCWRGGVPVGGNLLAESLPFLSAAPGPSAGAADWKEKNLQTNEVQPLKCHVHLAAGPPLVASAPPPRATRAAAGQRQRKRGARPHRRPGCTADPPLGACAPPSRAARAAARRRRQWWGLRPERRRGQLQRGVRAHRHPGCAQRSA